MQSRARNSLQCGNCTDWLKLEYTSLSEEVITDGVTIYVDRLPMLVCPTCSQTYFTPRTLVLLAYTAKEAHARNSSVVINSKIANRTRFNYCQQIDFKYDATDYSHIPGLARPQMNGALTPIFFKKKVLQYFRSDPSYRIEHISDTYGTIYCDKWYISYGVTRNDKVICWLYDLDELDEDVQLLFKSCNIESDHDIASDFYAAQINAIFTSLTPAYKLFTQIKSINQLTKDKFDIELFKEPDFNRQESASRPIFWNKDNVLPAVNTLNQVCIESIKVDILKSEIKKKDLKFDLTRLKGLNLLNKWIQLYCLNLDSQAIMKPLFVLYDFRNIFEHDTGNEEEKILKSCYERMVVSEQNFENLYDTIVKGISNSFDELIRDITHSRG